jgi:hypothetical protein
LDSLQEVKDQITRNQSGLERLKCYIVKLLGNYYLKELPKGRFEAEWDQAFVEIEDLIHTDEELSSVLTQVGRPKFDRKGLQWRFFLVKNFKDLGSSVLIFKINHLMSDGIGVLLLAAALQNG